MKEKLLMGVIALAAFWVISGTECKAEIAGDDAFSNLIWEQVFEDNLIGSEGVVQSVCATDNYIICIENTTDTQDVPDVVSAYYRNDVDEEGNPVQRYSLAKRVNDINWEHGNGMAYNPSAHEIYVSLYTHQNPENRGSLYVMNPDTLEFKGKIKISDDYNILGIDYVEETDQYIIQTNSDGGYSFKVLDAAFQVIDDLGQYADTAKGDNFQDLVVSGDYILNFPLTLNLGIGDYLHAYSISRRTMVADPKLDFRFEGITMDEPESMCEIEPGVFLAAVNLENTAGERKIRFYKTEIPYYFNVTINAENGTVSQGGKVLRGQAMPITYEAPEGLELSKLEVNGQEMDVRDYKDGYTLENIRQDCDIKIAFAEPGQIPVEVKKAGWASGLINQTYFGNKGIMTILVPIFIFSMGVAFGGFLFHLRMERRRKLLHARELRKQIALKRRQHF